MFAVVVVAVLVWGGVASAITYGQPDGNKHPNVGALVGTFDGQTYPYCSGTLISPTVFLTAAHCDIGTEQVYVTFDSTYTSESKLYSGTFYSVGYGGQEAVNQPGGPVIGYLDTREYAVSTFNAVGPSYLRLSQNPATGNGGTCYGDSGGSNFLGAGSTETNIIAGITITGDALCKSTNVVYRLDTESARAFLSQFVTLQ